MKRVTLHLTAADVLRVQQDGFKNVALYLLAAETGTLWQMTDCGIGLEIMPPHRVSVVCQEYRKLWRNYQESGVLEPCEIKLDISGYSDTPAVDAIPALAPAPPTAPEPVSLSPRSRDNVMA
jgi:hypothetical protein